MLVCGRLSERLKTEKLSAAALEIAPNSALQHCCKFATVIKKSL